ncbi:MAG TPA: PRC-barrel domain-containing protein [Acetobacteraceae bacterium]|nr:PRC-barrel domain-containing protein [Acetobacteraceae bacterium]
MARHASIGTMLAATALISWPVLAQTTTSTSPATPPAGMTSSRTMTTTTTRPAAAETSSMASSSKYFTADHQVRVSKVVGASVYNDQNQSVGSVDDVLMSDNDHKAATAVISVGGFLGMGSKLVSVPFDQLKIENDRLVMPGATKASLEGMPEYHYTNA